MNPLLIRVVIGAVVITGSALFALFNHRNRSQSNLQRVNQTYTCTNWEPPQESSSDVCAVCLERLGNDRFRLPCKHQLHLDCAKALYKHVIDSTCPICRKAVSKEFLIKTGVC